MKKIYTIITLILAAILTLTACGRTSEANYTPHYESPQQEASPNPTQEPPPLPPTHTPTPATYPASNTPPFPSIHVTVADPTIPFNRELWRDATITITGADGLIPETINVPASMRGRGNTSWSSSPDKRPFRLRFDDNPQQMPFSSVAARDWTFLNQHSDYSLMRDATAFTLADMMDGMTVSPFFSFIHVYIDGEYMGLYMNSIQNNDPVPCGDNGRRASLVRNNDPALSDFMLEMCYRGVWNPDLRMGYELFRAGGILYRIRFGRTWAEHNAYVSSFMNDLHDAIIAKDPALFDMINFQSFVDWYIVHELFRDHDAARTSTYMQLRLCEDGRRYLEFGPVWDFDHAAAGSNWQLPAHPYHVWVPYGNPYHDGRYAHIWFYHLLQMPKFYDAVAARFIELRDYYLPNAIEHLMAMSNNNIECFDRNFQRHPVFGTQVMGMSSELVVIDSFRGHLYFLFHWLMIRADWLVGHFNGHSPYFTIEEIQLSPDTNAQAGEVTRPIHLRLETVNSRTTRARLAGYNIYHNGEVLHQGRFGYSYGGEIIFDIPYAIASLDGEITVSISYALLWQATELVPAGEHVPVRPVSLRLRLAGNF